MSEPHTRCCVLCGEVATFNFLENFQSRDFISHKIEKLPHGTQRLRVGEVWVKN